MGPKQPSNHPWKLHRDKSHTYIPNPISQNGKYLTYPKIDHEQTWNFSLILSIFDFKCKILDQNATINDRDIINTSVKV